jgi:hypothetical protein
MVKQKLKKYIEKNIFSSPLTIARMAMAGYGGYPKSWDKVDTEKRTILDNVWSRGFHVIENFYTPEECAVLRDEVDGVLKKHEDIVSYDELIGDARLFGAEKVSQKIDVFNKDAFLQELSDLYHGEHAPAPFTMSARLKVNDINRGKNHGWHRDSMRRQFKAIVYLDDTSKDNGPFQYVVGSNHWNKIFLDGIKGNIPYMSSAVTAESVDKIVKNAPDRLATITGKAGSVIVADTSGIHRGSGIIDGHRYALTNYYMFQDLIGPRMNSYFGPMAYRANSE